MSSIPLDEFRRKPRRGRQRRVGRRIRVRAISLLTLERIDPTFGSVTRARRLPFVVTDSGSVSGRGRTLLIAPRSGLDAHRHAQRTHALAGRPECRLVRRCDRVRGRGSPTVRRTWSSASINAGRSRRFRSAEARRRSRRESALSGLRTRWTGRLIDPATGAVITTIAVGSIRRRSLRQVTASGWQTQGTGRSPNPRAHRSDHREGRGGWQPAVARRGAGRVWASVQTPPRVQPEGGTIVVGVPPFMTTLDPAVAFNGAASTVLYATCTWLLATRTSRVRQACGSFPTRHARSPMSARTDARTRTRSDRDFASATSNQPVTAETFKYSIERSSYTRLERGGPPGQMFLEDVVGAQAYFAGKARHIAGIEAHGDRLTVHLTEPRRPAGAPRHVTVLCRSDRHADKAHLRPAPERGSLLRRSGHTETGLRAAPQPQLPRRPPAPVEADRDRHHPSHPIAQIQASKLDYTLTAGPAQDAALARIGRLVRARRASADLRQRYHTTRTTTLDYLEAQHQTADLP